MKTSLTRRFVGALAVFAVVATVLWLALMPALLEGAEVALLGVQHTAPIPAKVAPGALVQEEPRHYAPAILSVSGEAEWSEVTFRLKPLMEYGQSTKPRELAPVSLWLTNGSYHTPDIVAKLWPGIASADGLLLIESPTAEVAAGAYRDTRARLHDPKVESLDSYEYTRTGSLLIPSPEWPMYLQVYNPGPGTGILELDGDYFAFDADGYPRLLAVPEVDSWTHRLCVGCEPSGYGGSWNVDQPLRVLIYAEDPNTGAWIVLQPLAGGD